MRSTHFPRLINSGTLSVNGRKWLIQTYYPQYPKRNYCIYSVCPTDKPTQGLSFTTEQAFEQWLGDTMQGTQLQLPLSFMQ